MNTDLEQGVKDFIRGYQSALYVFVEILKERKYDPIENTIKFFDEQLKTEKRG